MMVVITIIKIQQILIITTASGTEQQQMRHGRCKIIMEIMKRLSMTIAVI